MPRLLFRNSRVAFNVRRSTSRLPHPSVTYQLNLLCYLCSEPVPATKGPRIASLKPTNRDDSLTAPPNAERRTLFHRNQKMLPIADIVGVPNKGTDRQLTGCLRFLF